MSFSPLNELSDSQLVQLTPYRRKCQKWSIQALRSLVELRNRHDNCSWGEFAKRFFRDRGYRRIDIYSRHYEFLHRRYPWKKETRAEVVNPRWPSNECVSECAYPSPQQTPKSLRYEDAVEQCPRRRVNESVVETPCPSAAKSNAKNVKKPAKVSKRTTRTVSRRRTTREESVRQLRRTESPCPEGKGNCFPERPRLPRISPCASDPSVKGTAQRFRGDLDFLVQQANRYEIERERVDRLEKELDEAKLRIAQLEKICRQTLELEVEALLVQFKGRR
ncbi:hypothetical protein VTO42DRAFT_8410 [Malbranchea cinnamomea]